MNSYPDKTKKKKNMNSYRTKGISTFLGVSSSSDMSSSESSSRSSSDWNRTCDKPWMLHQLLTEKNTSSPIITEACISRTNNCTNNKISLLYTTFSFGRNLTVVNIRFKIDNPRMRG